MVGRQDLVQNLSLHLDIDGFTTTQNQILGARQWDTKLSTDKEDDWSDE